MQDTPGICPHCGKELVPVGMLGTDVILGYACEDCDREDNDE